MHFALTPEQELARNALRELLSEHCSATHLRKVFEASEAARVPGLWAKLHELGVIGALAPEALGGVGLNAIDLTVLLEETGRAAVPEPVVETASVAVPLLAALPDNPRAAQLLQGVLGGQLSVSVSLAEGALVPHGACAGVVLCERSGELHAVALAARDGDNDNGSGVPAADCGSRLKVERLESVDRARPLYRFEFGAREATCLARGETARQLLAAARDHAALGTAAQLVGLGLRMLELTIAHVKTRKQFGQPVGAFQAVKHQLVDARLALEFAAPLVYRAAHSIAHAGPARSLHVSMAKAYASEAALLTARKALQLHGAIGYSYEYELHMYMKRAWALAAAYGDAREHRKRIADVLLTAQGESYA
jgi:alkylation response protein AidB-like acyl-CoA dehydrogenase